MSPGALPSGGLVFQLVCRFHRYRAYSSKSTVQPKMESCFQDGACSVCFLLHYQLEMHIGDIFRGENCMRDLLEKTQYTSEGLDKQACQNVC